MKRNPRKVRWTKAFRKAAGKEMTIVSYFLTELTISSDRGAQDSTIDFEKRRNVPVRYDRDLIQTTIKAMKRVGEIKSRRERAFFKNRYVVVFSFPNYLLHPAQNGRQSGKAKSTPQKDHGGNKSVCKIARAYRSRVASRVENPGKDQGSHKVQKCTGAGGRSIDGNGYRLILHITGQWEVSSCISLITGRFPYIIQRMHLCYVKVQMQCSASRATLKN